MIRDDLSALVQQMLDRGILYDDAQREFERGHRRERGTNAENLQQFAGRAVRGDDALAQAIAEEWSFGPFVRERYGCHGGPRVRAATLGPARTRFIGSAANR